MDYERYREIMLTNQDKEFVMPLKPVEIGLLLGAVRLMLIHPDVEAYSPEFKQAAQNIRERLLNGFRIMGCSEDEIEALDTQFA